MNDAHNEWIRVLKLEAQGLQDAANRFESPEAKRVIAQVTEGLQACYTSGGKIVLTGVGKSGKIAEKVAATLCATGSLAVFLHPTEGLHGDLGVVGPRDWVLAFSHGGNSEELAKLLPSLKARGVTLVAFTGNPASLLARSANFVIDAAVSQEACPHNLTPTTSTTLAMALGDALALTLMQARGFDAEAFARNHPAGALGKRLTLKVSDLMHEREKCAVVAESAGMEEVISSSTRAKLGAVLVCEGKSLRGIITDGDLRRALSHKARFFEMTAREVMTVKPIVCSPVQAAQEALRIMEERSSQISVLPVVSEAGEALGVIRLHDLVQNL